MEILENRSELRRLFNYHTDSVKEMYVCKFENFVNWLRDAGHEENGDGYIEIPSNETKSGHAEVLDW